MGFYQLSKEERLKLVEQINKHMLTGIQKSNAKKLREYFSDEDTYIRKTAYLAIGKIFKEHPDLQKKIITLLDALMKEQDFKIRQTSTNAAGEIGIKEFEIVEHFFDRGLFDEHHSVRNAVIGSVKKMGNKNPKPVLKWAQRYLRHEDKEIRREICHGIELRGRTHPEDILPMLRELQHDKTARVKNTLVHVLGQIAYKKGCIEKVIAHLKTWDNRQVVEKALEEIIDVHDRYKDFAVLSQKQARDYIEKNF
ncbi:MAG: HEAT repeat domain-containing protein [Cytophagaceae bacterium]